VKSHKSLGTSRCKRHAKARATKREDAPVSIGVAPNGNHPTGFAEELNWNGKWHIRQRWPGEPCSVLAKSFHCDTWESAFIPLAEKSSMMIVLRNEQSYARPYLVQLREQRIDGVMFQPSTKLVRIKE
jgi:hypothetical protein